MYETAVCRHINDDTTHRSQWWLYSYCHLSVHRSGRGVDAATCGISNHLCYRLQVSSRTEINCQVSYL